MPPLIADELLVIAYHPDGMVHVKGVQLDCALAGALLLELAVAGAVEHRGGRLHAVSDTDPPAHPTLATALASIVAEPGQTAQRWVLAHAAGLRRRLLDGLVAARVLADEEYRWFGVLARHRFPERDASTRVDALHRLHAIASDDVQPDPPTAALATVVTAAGLGDRVWSDQQHHAVQRRLTGFALGAWASDAVAKAARTAYTRKMTV